MTLPFTRLAFLHLFGAFNRTTWPVLLLLWLASLVCVAALARGTVPGRRVSAWLAVHWLWSGVAYHAWFFTRINPSALVFAGLFVVQGLLFARAALRGDLTFAWEPTLRQVSGLAFTVAALAYPLLALASGHRLPEVPLFGVPCPTVLFTVGVLLCAHGPVARPLLVIPLAWCFVGGSASLLLGMTPDVLLFASAAALMPLLLPARALRAVERWGTPELDAQRPMQGDPLAAPPSYEMTLTRIVRARPGDVWPWLLQLGFRRGGLYSYDWLDRVFGFLDRPSAEALIPEFQHLEAGDVIPVGRGAGFPVRMVDDGNSLVLGGQEGTTRWSWEIALEPMDAGRTRIISRSRGQMPHTSAARVFVALLGPAAFLMTRRMLIGLAMRGEALAARGARAT